MPKTPFVTEIPTSSWTPTREDQEALDFVEDRLNAMDTQKKALHLEEDWNKWEKQMSTDEVTRNSELNIKNPSKVKNNLTRTAVFSILALTLARNSEHQLLAQDEEDDKIAPVLEGILTFVDEKIKRPMVDMKNILTTLGYGTGILKEFYRSDTKTVKEIQDYDPETEEVTYKETTVEDYRDVYEKDIDPRMFYIDERATSMDDAIDCAERMVIPYSSFSYAYPTKKYKNAQFVSPGGWWRGEKDDLRAETLLGSIEEDQVEIIEYWNKQKDLRLVVANGVLLTKPDNPNPYKHKELPYSASIFQLRDGQHFWGVGICELLEHDQALLDTLYNMMVDQAKLSINKPMLRGGGESDEDEKMELEAGLVIDVTDVNNFKELNISAPDAAFYQMLQRVEQNAYKKIGVDDPMYGVKSGGTATENAIAAQSSKDRLGLFFKGLEEDTDVRRIRLKLGIIQQMYALPERVEQIIDSSGQVVLQAYFRKLPLNLEAKQDEFGKPTFEDVEGARTEIRPETVGVYEDRMAQFEVRVKSRSEVPISKELMQKKWSEMIQTISAIPMMAPLVNWNEVAVKTFERFGETSDSLLSDQVSATEEMNRLAETENKEMLKGEQVPPTQGATPEHSNRHRALIMSPEFKALDPAVQQVFTTHYEGELVEQQVAEAEKLVEEARNAQNQEMMQNKQFEQEKTLKETAPPPPPTEIKQPVTA